MIRRFFALSALMATLAACDVALAPGPMGNGGIASQTQATPIPRDQRAMARAFVDVVERLEPVAERECRNRSRGLNCDFLIVVDDDPDAPVNALQTVDDTGRPIIAFTIAMIAEARNTDEIAFVMAHEAAHHVENHLQQMRRNATLGAVVFGQLAGVTGGGADAVRSAQEIGAAIGARTYSKEFELQADSLGTIIAARAGFDPVRGAEFFFRVPDPGDQFLGTHPPNADRVQIVLQTARQLGF